MGKSSGKGKRARWRRIDTSEVSAVLMFVLVCIDNWRRFIFGASYTAVLTQVEDAAALKSAAERQGKDVEVLPDAKLFFIDKVLEAFPDVFCGTLG